MKSLIIAVLLFASFAYATPAGHPIPFADLPRIGFETQHVESAHRSALLNFMSRARRFLAFDSKAEDECATYTALDKLLRLTQEAYSGSIFGMTLGGMDDALRTAQKGQDDWCRGDGAKGAEKIAPALDKMRAAMRGPMFQEQMREVRTLVAKGQPLTPAQAALLIAAGLSALASAPIWAT